MMYIDKLYAKMNRIINNIIVYILYKKIAKRYVDTAIKYNNLFAFNKVGVDERKKIDVLWKNLSVSGKYRYEWHSFYKGFCGYFDERFIPSDIYNGLVEHTLNLRKYSTCLQHKAFLGNFIESKNRCITIMNIIDNICYDENFNILSNKKAIDKIKSSNSNIIIKPSTSSGGGRKVTFLNCKNVKEKDIINNGDCIIQEFFNEGYDLARFNPTTLNTVRILTLNLNGKCSILSAFFRMGIKGMCVDNLSAGGILVGIKSDGSLYDFALNEKLHKIYASPSGITFKGEILSCYNTLKEFVLNNHRKFALANLIAWDLAIDKDGNPICIEINLDSGEIQFHQIYNGPLFGERTNEVIEYVKSHSLNNIRVIRNI